jgi:hypothetical protein
MRHVALALALGALLATAPTSALTYYECSYTSLPQCKASASGRAALCVINPYYAAARVADPPLRHRHHLHAY